MATTRVSKTVVENRENRGSTRVKSSTTHVTRSKGEGSKSCTRIIKRRTVREPKKKKGCASVCEKSGDKPNIKVCLGHELNGPSK